MFTFLPFIIKSTNCSFTKAGSTRKSGICIITWSSFTNKSGICIITWSSFTRESYNCTFTSGTKKATGATPQGAPAAGIHNL